jgi:hypothetical protein
MPTKIQIEKAVQKKHSLSPDQASLHKAGGFWYWVGDLPATSPSDNCTYYTNLSDVDIDRWVSDFEFYVLQPATSR